MICPKCFTVEKDDGLRCRKCGAQLQTGLFRQPLPTDQAPEADPVARGRFSRRGSLVVVAVLAVAALALLLLLGALEAMI